MLSSNMVSWEYMTINIAFYDHWIIKWIQSKSVEAIKSAVTTELRGIPEESFLQCIEAWKRRMGKYIRLNGYYIER